jgi:hypothetical protein
VDAVRKNDLPAAKLREHAAALTVEFENRVEVRAGAAVRAAAVVRPDVAVRVDVDARRVAPHAAAGQHAPVLDDHRIWIRERLRRGVDDVRLCLREHERATDGDDTNGGQRE